MYRVQTYGFSKTHNDYTRDLGSEEIEAANDSEAKTIFSGNDWQTPEGGKQQHVLLVEREGPQGDEQTLDEKYSS